MNTEKTFIDLFSGIGGFHYALHSIGFKCVFACEINKYSRITYKDNFSSISPELFLNNDRYFPKDIIKVNTNDIPNFDLLTAGFPCQPFSYMGKKKSFDDEKNGSLFLEIIRIIKDKQPKAFLLENVPGLLKNNNGSNFETIKNIIENELNYSFYFKILKASDFNLPQHRPRLYMVGFKDKSIKFEFPEPIPRNITMSNVWDNQPCNKEIGSTLRVGGRRTNINNKRNWDGYIVNGEIKRLTSKEGKKMMGFPDDFIFNVSENQAMKQLGNSVAINVVQYIGKNILNKL